MSKVWTLDELVANTLPSLRPGMRLFDESEVLDELEALFVPGECEQTEECFVHWLKAHGRLP